MCVNSLWTPPTGRRRTDKGQTRARAVQPVPPSAPSPTTSHPSITPRVIKAASLLFLYVEFSFKMSEMDKITEWRIVFSLDNGDPSTWIAFRESYRNAQGMDGWIDENARVRKEQGRWHWKTVAPDRRPQKSPRWSPWHVNIVEISLLTGFWCKKRFDKGWKVDD